MGLDVSLYIEVDVGKKEKKEIELYWANITHNLAKMAEAAGLYECLWKPDEIGAKYAKDIINCLENGLKELKSNPKKYKKYNSPNGWGLYKYFVPFVEKYLDACKEYPKALISVSR